MNNLKDLFEKIITKIYCLRLPQRVSTSLSDNQAYPQICLDAANQYKYFNKFRRNSFYASIVETVTGATGKKYLNVLLDDEQLMGKIDELKRNDLWGGPRTYSYEKVGRVSPTTLRYIKVFSDLQKYFGSLDGLKICEIGVGYGGQCRIITAASSPRIYCLVDIQPALLLAQRYLGNYISKAILSYSTMNELDDQNYDLCISNYSFSELPRTLQEVYLKKVILNSKAGYITYSDNFTPQGFNSYRVDELLKIIPGATKIEEVPKTGPNFIILWGIKNNAL